MTTTGSIARSYTVPALMYDIAYDWRKQLIWGGLNLVTCFGCTTTGSLVASFNKPLGNIYGITYYGEYLWLAGTSGYIYRQHCPGNLTVAPASLGKVKALFR